MAHTSEAIGWSFDLLPIAAAVAASAAYELRAHSPALRGRRPPLWRRLSFHAGVAAVLLALISPLDPLAETRLFYAHMIQHLTIGEAAPLLILLGLSGVVLRPVLALRGLRGLRRLAGPFVALPLWLLNLYAWHVPALYDLALSSHAVHWLEHACFFAAGLLMWGAVIEPLPGPAWFGSGAKAIYVLVVRLLGCALLANILIWSGTPLYPFYRAGEAAWGIEPLLDQQIGGAIMLVWGAGITFVVFAWLFLRWVREAELRQSLLDAGVDVRAASRAARFGRRPVARPGSPPAP